MVKTYIIKGAVAALLLSTPGVLYAVKGTPAQNTADAKLDENAERWVDMSPPVLCKQAWTIQLKLMEKEGNGLGKTFAEFQNSAYGSVELEWCLREYRALKSERPDRYMDIAIVVGGTFEGVYLMDNYRSSLAEIAKKAQAEDSGDKMH
jgi:hypothetical protein